MENEEEKFQKDFDERYQKQIEKEEAQFAKAFNAGYLLSQHEPELLNRILQSPNEDIHYLQVMKYGKKQHEKDKVLEQIKKTQEKSKTQQHER